MSQVVKYRKIFKQPDSRNMILQMLEILLFHVHISISSRTCVTGRWLLIKAETCQVFPSAIHSIGVLHSSILYGLDHTPHLCGPNLTAYAYSAVGIPCDCT